MKKKNRLQMLAALLAAIGEVNAMLSVAASNAASMALTSPIAAKANEEYNVDTTKESNADTGRIYYLKNSHGDVIGQMDETGTVLTSYAYNAFGEQVSAVATKGEQKSTSNRFLYAGEQYDETSGFYYLRARHYDSKAGRFTQEDTYLGDGRNLYAYVHSNPLKYVDPTGHVSQEIYEPDTNLMDDLEDKSIDGGKMSGNTGTNSASSSAGVKVVCNPEVKAPTQVKASEVTNYWDNYLGTNQTSINPIKGTIDNDRIFSSDGSKSIRFGNHEMNELGSTKAHFHQESWVFDSINNTVEYNNTLVRIDCK